MLDPDIFIYSTVKMKTILFVCTGNYYRSRLAELYFNQLAQKHKLPWKALSVGTEADQGHNEGPISIHTIEACAEFNIPLAKPYRFPEQIAKGHLTEASTIILLNEEEHLPYLQSKFPDHINSNITSWKILDIDYEKPETAIQALMIKVDDLVETLKLDEQR